MTEQKKYAFQNVKVNNSNNITFSSNNEKERIAVLSIPYDAGWSLTSTKNGVTKDVNIYKGNGGFISFVVPSGEVSYSLTYTTPKLWIGTMGFIVGSMALALAYYSFNIIKEEKEFIKKAISLN
jgi:uncharacterized membrane protein YfhO